MRVNPSVFVRPLVVLSCLLALFAGQSAWAQSSPTVNYQDHIHLTSFLLDNDLPGDLYDTLSRGHYLYAVTGLHFCVIDVGDRHRPQLLGSVAVDTGARELALSGDDSHAVVVGSGGLGIIDCSDPNAPWVTDTYEYSYGYLYLAVVGNLALVSTQYSGATLFDITSPDDIRYLRNVDIPSTRGVTGYGEFVYLCGDGLTVLDLRDPASPVVAGTVGQGNTYAKLVCQGDLGYVTGSIGGVGLHVYDLSDPAAPVLIGVRDEGYYGDHIAVVGDRAYVAGDDGNNDGFAIYDVSDPTHPTKQVEVKSAHCLSIAGSECYVYAGGFDGLRIFNAVNTTVAGPYDPPSFPTSYSDLGVLTDMVSDGDRTYVYSTVYLYVYEWGTGNNPQFLDRVHLGDYYIRGMAVTGDIVLLGDGSSGVRIIDISDLANPQECGTVDTPGYARDIFVFGTVALVVDAGTIQILDFADPYQATLVGELDTPGNGLDAVLEGDTLFLAADSAGVQVIDVTAPLAPVILGSAAADGASRLAYENGLLAVALDIFDPEIRFFDVTNPAHPTFLGAASLPDAHDVALADGFAYVAAFDDGIIVLDARDPEHPYSMGTIFDYYRSTDLYRLDDYILCGEYLGMVPLQHAGVSGLGETPEPAISGACLRAYPNPFNPKTTVSFRVEQAGPVKLRIFDLAGRKVATLADRVYPAGEYEIDWTGHDDRGRAVPSGVYFVQVKTKDGSDTRKISLVR